jgi:hypothetical protein
MISMNCLMTFDSVVGEGPCALPLPGMAKTLRPRGDTILDPSCVTRISRSRIRADTEVRPYLANNDYTMQVVGMICITFNSMPYPL